MIFDHHHNWHLIQRHVHVREPVLRFVVAIVESVFPVVAVALEMSRVFDRIVVADQRDIAIVLELVGVTVAVTARVECHKRTMSKESWRPFPTSTSSLSL